MMMGMPEDMIGAIKIKDGLFIGDEFAAQVSCLYSALCMDVEDLCMGCVLRT